MDVVFIAESEKLLFGELRAVVRDNGVRDSKAMDDVKEEQHGFLELDRGDRSLSCHLAHHQARQNAEI